MKKITIFEDDLPADVTFKGSVAVDTETMGLKWQRDRLCLVQLADGNGNAYLVKLQSGNYACPSLKALLWDKHIQKIFHYGRFDMAVLKHYLGVMPDNVYCTKIASRLVRTYTDRHGLKELVKELLGVDLSKQQQSSNWGAEDLTNDQMEYAASDVLYLHAAKAALDKMLQRERRVELAKQCFDFLPARVALDLAGWGEEDIFAHS